ncbi:MAG: hypothetical protein K2L37_03215, partial [Lactobacillus sp.]|nr:hypothetical protein [Lactobacillus sp.]
YKKGRYKHMLKVGVIGCGNMGNQVVALLDKTYKDIPVYAINCSENDLDTLSDDLSKVLIGDGRGAGKNREEAKKFLEAAIMQFITDDDIKKFLESLDIVFIVSSAGGGTGSGVSILLANVINEVFKNSEDPVIPIPVGALPTIGEALGTQANALSYLTELYELSDDLTYMLYDNEKYAKKSSVEILRDVNKDIVEDINIIRLFYNYATVYSSIDERDAKTIFSTPGRIFIASVFDVKEKDCDDDNTLEDMLITEIKRNSQAEIQLDGIVNRTGVIVNLSESMLKKFNEKVPKIQAMVGTPVEDFVHIKVNEDRKLANNVIYIAAGLSPINDRIAKIKDRIDEINELQDKQKDTNELDDSILEEIQKKRVYKNTEGVNDKDGEKTSKQDIMGIFSKFRK